MVLLVVSQYFSGTSAFPEQNFYLNFTELIENDTCHVFSTYLCQDQDATE